MRTLPYALAFAVAACGGGDDGNTIDAPHNTSDAPKPVDAPKPADAPADAPKPALTTFDLGSGGANDLLWDGSSSTLYLTDGTANKLLAFTESNGSGVLTTVATLPAIAAGESPGGLVKLADGSILVANFGFGTAGSIFQVPPGANPTVVNLTNLDATRRRIGLAEDSTGKLYDAYFTKNGNTVNGGVGVFTVGSGSALETELQGASNSAGYGKMVGVAATTTAVFASDQSNKVIYKITIPGNVTSVFATGLPAADLLLLLPDGDMLTGGGSGVSRISGSGAVSALAEAGSGFEDVEGMAFDPVGHRLFIIDHATGTKEDTLHIVPFTP